jgi:hypothetical protein
MATDAFQLAYDILRLDPSSKSQRDETTDRLRLGSRTSPRLSDLIKNLKRFPIRIFVYGDIEVPTTSADLSSRPMNYILASLGLPLPLSQLLFFLRSILARGNRPFIEDLLGSTPIAVDGHSFAT